LLDRSSPLPSSLRKPNVVFRDGRPPQEFVGTAVTTQLIHSFVAEEANPKNTLGINRIEVSHPGLALQNTGLIDTPGIGSTHAHNTATTLSFLPQCDAALFVLNKIDVLEADDVARLQAFLDGVLRERAGLGGRPCRISMRQCAASASIWSDSSRRRSPQPARLSV